MIDHSFRDIEQTALDMRFNEYCQGHAAEDGNGTWPYLPVLHQLALMEKDAPTPTTIIEIGVHTGRSTVALLAALAHSDATLISIDIKPPHRNLVELVTFCKEKGLMSCNWEFLGMDSADHKTLETVMQILKKHDPYLGQANMLFVDGAFENRLTDLSFYAPLVKTLGTIVVHDTNGTMVYDQVQTYLKQCSFKTRVATMTQGHGLMVISKRMPYEPLG